ncbi:MAG: hypothetical protein BWX86_02662 [Verrucomicrobia bacterium ADurb.Bin122]|nr:MAG: hypothetical protein BWX86_02662 [Verrucomicrobia bacterium ADurb.Bin122]
MLSGLPFRAKTACVCTSRHEVSEPAAESPSTMKSVLSSARLSFVSRCTRQSRSLRLCREAFLARSRAMLRMPASSLRSRSLSSILRLRASAASGLRWSQLSRCCWRNWPTNWRIEGPPGPMSAEPSLVLVCDSKTGSITRTAMAATTDWRMSAASYSFLKKLRTVCTRPSRKAARCVPPMVVCWPLTKL